MISWMKKDYKLWTPEKEKINNNESIRPGFYEREVWYCYLGENVGFEQDGKGETFLRPVIVLKKFNKEIFWAIPLTSAIKKSIYYYTVTFGNNRKSSAILSQIRLVDAKRLSHKVGDVCKEDLDGLKKKLKELIP